MSRCPQFERLSRYHDGLADESLEGHLAACAACREELAGIDRLDALIQTGLDAPRPLRLPWLRPAMAACLIAAAGLLLLQTPQPAADSETSAVSRIVAVEGPHRVSPNEILHDGDALITRGGERLKLHVSDRAEVLVNENSRIRIESDRAVALDQGEIFAISVEPLCVRTSEGEAWIQSGEARVTATDRGVSVTLIKGLGEFRERKLVPTRSAPDLRWAEPMRYVLYEDGFDDPAPSPVWRVPRTGSISCGSVEGRTALKLATPPSRKKDARAVLGTRLPVRNRLVLEFDLRLPAAEGAAFLFTLQGMGGGNPVFRYAMSAREERLDVSAAKETVRLWTGTSPAWDGGWHRFRFVISPQSIELSRDGRVLAQAAHAFPEIQRVAVGLGIHSGASKTGLEAWLDDWRISLGREP